MLMPSVYADGIVEELFKGRKGHSNGPCTKRNLSPSQLREIIAQAYQAGVDAEVAKAALQVAQKASQTQG